jgi:hypothetical protein
MQDCRSRRSDGCHDDIVPDGWIPGLAVGVIENRQLVYARAFGVKHLERPADPLITRSVFHMASVTKPKVAIPATARIWSCSPTRGLPLSGWKTPIGRPATTA